MPTDLFDPAQVEKAKAAAPLRYTESRYHSLFSEMTEGFALHEIICDASGQPCDYRFLDVNPAFELLTGLRRDDVVGRTHNEVLPADDPRWVREYGAVALSGVPVRFENYSPALNRYYSVHAYQPAPYQFAVIFMDISEQKRVDEQLRFQASLIQRLADAVITADLQFYIANWNPAAEVMYGWRSDEVIGKSVNSVLGTTYQNETPEQVRDIFQQQGFWKGEAQQRRKDGSTIDVMASVTLMKDISGNGIGIVAVNRDISDRKHAESELRSVAKFPEQNPSPILRASMDGTVLYANRASAPLLAALHSAVGERLPDTWIKLIAGIALAGEVMESEFTYEGKTLALTFTPIKEEGYVNIYGRDITETKRAVEALHRSHAELERRVHERTAELARANQLLVAHLDIRRRAEESLELERTKLKSILDAIPDNVYIVDAQYDIQYTNPALEREFGIANGCKCYQYIHGRTDPCPWCLIGAVITGNSVRNELYLSHKGKTFDTYEAPLQNADGSIAILKIMHDVTARKEAAEQIIQHNRELAILYDIGRAITATPDLNNVIRQLLTQLREVLRTSVWAIGLYNNATNDVAFYRLVGEDDALALTDIWHIKQDESIFARVTRLRQSVIVDDAANGLLAQYALFSVPSLVIHSMACIPLFSQDAVIGVIYALDPQIAAFSGNIVRMLESVATQAAVVIQNAQLYEAEQSARRTAETLRNASMSFAQTLDLDRVLNALLDYVKLVVPYDSARIVLLEDESRLVVKVMRGYEHWTDPELVRSSTLDIAGSNPIIRAALRGNASVLLQDTHQQPDWRSGPGLEHIRSWIGVPIAAEGKVIGLCSLDKVDPNFFTQAHLQLTEALVGQAAVAVQNAWLFAQVRSGRERLSALSHRLVQVQDAERAYIARELHDEAGQSLTTLLVGLRLLKDDAEDPTAITAGADELSRMTEEVLENLHRIAINLRPASLDHLGLVAALRQHVDVLSRRHSLAIGLNSTDFGTQRLSPSAETNLYRIIQEALTNIARHAHATRADVLLTRGEGNVMVSVSDNGDGFDTSSILAQDGRLGLFGMRERAEMLGGTLTINSTPGTGTTVTIEVPYDDSHNDS